MNDSDIDPEPEFVPWPYNVYSSDEKEDSEAVAVATISPESREAGDKDCPTMPEHPKERRCKLGVKSPYETRENLEDRDELFTQLDNLLGGQYEGDCVLDPSKRRLLRDYHEHIEKMGLAYRSAWVKGNMDGKQLEPFEDPQLFILCLSAYAFGKADRSSLMALSKDLNLASMVKSAVVEWKLEAHCPLITSNTSSLRLVKSSKALKSMIFVARVTSALHTLGVEMTPELRYITENILIIIENNLSGINKESKALEENKTKPQSLNLSRNERKRKAGTMASLSRSEAIVSTAKIHKKNSSSREAWTEDSSMTKKSSPNFSSVNFSATYALLPSPSTLSSLENDDSNTPMPPDDRMDQLESLFLHGREAALRLTSFFHDGLNEVRKLRKDVAAQEEGVKAQMIDSFQKSLNARK